MTQYTYLLVNAGALSIPLLYSFHPKLRFDKHWKAIVLAMLITGIPFIIWDVLFAQMRIWGFNPEYTSGLYVYNLPIEEILFFICIPYACVFTWHCFQILLTRFPFRNAEKYIGPSLIVGLLIAALFYHDRAYTATTFLALSITLIILHYLLKVKWMHKFYFTYLVLLLPFTVFNGILTGFGLEQPVVWYDDSTNMNLRILTIPLEDVFYGMLLILINISFYEYIKRKHTS